MEAHMVGPGELYKGRFENVSRIAVKDMRLQKPTLCPLTLDLTSSGSCSNGSYSHSSHISHISHNGRSSNAYTCKSVELDEATKGTVDITSKGIFFRVLASSPVPSSTPSSSSDAPSSSSLFPSSSSSSTTTTTKTTTSSSSSSSSSVGVSPIVSPPIVKPDWVCLGCTFINETSSNMCIMCGTRKVKANEVDKKSRANQSNANTAGAGTSGSAQGAQISSPLPSAVAKKKKLSRLESLQEQICNTLDIPSSLSLTEVIATWNSAVGDVDPAMSQNNAIEAIAITLGISAAPDADDTADETSTPEEIAVIHPPKETAETIDGKPAINRIVSTFASTIDATLWDIAGKDSWVPSINNNSLRLTSTKSNTAGVAVLKQSFASTLSLDISFKMAMYGGSGADGLSLSLYSPDYSLSECTRRTGGAMTYLGSPKGILSVGFDTFGGIFSGSKPNSISMRGAYPTNELFGDKFTYRPTQSGATSSPSLFVKSRDKTQSTVNVRVVIDPLNMEYGRIKVFINDLSNTSVPVLDNLIPMSIRAKQIGSFNLAFGAATGAVNNYHDIWDVKVATYEGGICSFIGDQTCIPLNASCNGDIVPDVDRDRHAMVERIKLLLGASDKNVSVERSLIVDKAIVKCKEGDPAFFLDKSQAFYVNLTKILSFFDGFKEGVLFPIVINWTDVVGPIKYNQKEAKIAVATRDKLVILELNRDRDLSNDGGFVAQRDLRRFISYQADCYNNDTQTIVPQQHAQLQANKPLQNGNSSAYGAYNAYNGGGSYRTTSNGDIKPTPGLANVFGGNPPPSLFSSQSTYVPTSNPYFPSSSSSSSSLTSGAELMLKESVENLKEFNKIIVSMGPLGVTKMRTMIEKVESDLKAHTSSLTSSAHADIYNSIRDIKRQLERDFSTGSFVLRSQDSDEDEDYQEHLLDIERRQVQAGELQRSFRRDANQGEEEDINYSDGEGEEEEEEEQYSAFVYLDSHVGSSTLEDKIEEFDQMINEHFGFSVNIEGVFQSDAGVEYFQVTFDEQDHLEEVRRNVRRVRGIRLVTDRNEIGSSASASRQPYYSGYIPGGASSNNSSSSSSSSNSNTFKPNPYYSSGGNSSNGIYNAFEVGIDRAMNRSILGIYDVSTSSFNRHSTPNIVTYFDNIVSNNDFADTYWHTHK